MVETTGIVDIRGGDEDLAVEEASSVAVEGTAMEVVKTMPVDTMGVAWVLVVLAVRVVWGWLLVLRVLLLTVVGSEVAETRVVGVCRVLGGASVTTAAVLGVCVGVTVGLAGAGMVVLGALVLAGVGSEVLGARVELQGVLRGGLLVERGGLVTARGMVVCSLVIDGCGGEKVTTVAFSIVSSSSP